MKSFKLQFYNVFLSRPRRGIFTVAMLQPQMPFNETFCQLGVAKQTARVVLNCKEKKTEKNRLPTQARSQGIRKGGYILRGFGELPQKIFKFKVANTPKFNDFLQ